MDDLHGRIDALIAEEHGLREGGMDDAGRARVAEIEVTLDRLWDLLRRRDAAREFGTASPAEEMRPAGEVEGYLQ